MMDEVTWTLDKHKTDAHDAFFYIEAICNAWFSFEIATRFLVREANNPTPHSAKPFKGKRERERNQQKHIQPKECGKL